MPLALALAAVAAVAGVLLTQGAHAHHRPRLHALVVPLRTPRRRRGRARGSARPIQPPRPGIAHVVGSGPPRRDIALTFDDGFCARCVARIVHTLARTGTHATIFPNGMYARSWDAQRGLIRRLVREGRLVVGNHTFHHGNAALESSGALAADLGQNERWIEGTFGTTARPYFRPPYGAFNPSVLAEAGSLGYTRVVMWSGTVADSARRSVAYILRAVRHWARPGAIILMHGNYPATSLALPRMIAYLRRRHLRPVTLDELLRGGRLAPPHL